VDNKDYPITRPLYITTHGEPAGAVKDFLDWALSDEGQAIVKQRFVGVK
jgi:phosphate transport system substrate-binding protein